MKCKSLHCSELMAEKNRVLSGHRAALGDQISVWNGNLNAFVGSWTSVRMNFLLGIWVQKLLCIPSFWMQNNGWYWIQKKMQELHLSQSVSFFIRSHDATLYVHPLNTQIRSCCTQRSMLAFNELLNCLWSSSDAVWLGTSCQCLTIRAWSSL